MIQDNNIKVNVGRLFPIFAHKNIMPSKTEFLNKLNKIISDNKQFEGVVFQVLAEDGYVIPMVLRHAIKFSNETVDRVPRYSSADHGTNLKTLFKVIEKCMARRKYDKDVVFYPYFDMPIVIDPLVEECYGYERNLIFLQNIYISVESGFWQVSEPVNRFHMNLSASLRRSALSLLADKADFVFMDEENQDIVMGKSEKDLVLLTLKIGLTELEILENGLPVAWNRLVNSWSFSKDEVVSFQGFIAFLTTNTGSLWYQLDDLWEIWQEYTVKYQQVTIDKDDFANLLNFFAVTVHTGLEWGIAFPFIKIYNWYAFWPFFFHVLHPNLGLLSIVMRKFQTEWNNSIGAEFAKVANYLMALLEPHPNIYVSALRKKKNIGDIDLAIYDENSGHLLICEIKSVFDRFRTNYQLANFVEQKVNFSKANEQLRRSKTAIENGEWSLKDIFRKKIDGKPNSISLLILTWWDIVNPNLGTNDADILCATFKVFRYLYKKANGDLFEFVNAIKQLSQIYCVAHLTPIVLSTPSEKETSSTLEFVLQVQTDGLPPLNKLNLSKLCNLAISEIKSLPKFPENWEEKVLQNGDKPENYYFYE